MTPTSDFAAFLISPNAGNDGPTDPAAKGAPASINVFTEDSVNSSDIIENAFGFTYEPTKILPDWASTSTIHVTPQEQPSNSLEQPTVAEAAFKGTQTEVVGSNDPARASVSYRSKFAPQQFSQPRHWLPQLGGTVGGASTGLGAASQRSSAGSNRSPSAPLRQTAPQVATKRVSDVTIQERRRLARRGYAVNLGHSILQESASKPATTRRSGSSPSSPANNSQQSSEFPSNSFFLNTQFSNLSNESTNRAYSHSGFDMIKALTMVAERSKPKIDIGPVDLSCSFTVSDAQHPDQPIVHCSDTFCELTGYSREEIIGRNCRFLQAPDGKVEKGTKRLHTDNDAVNHFRKNCKRMQECQTSLINYRRDGSPFINFVTVVPIAWGNSIDTVFLIGFHVDLVEHPAALLQRTPDGLYAVNYSNVTKDATPPLNALTNHIYEKTDLQTTDVNDEADKQNMMAHELAEVIGNGCGETSKWASVLLDNSHDLIHVLSLKGVFLYVSHSVERLLGFKPEELLGRCVSDFCHPSDVVPVFRELKDSTSNSSIAAAALRWARMGGTVNLITKGDAGQTGPQVNLIMRMRHKHHGHQWIENVGKVHLEQRNGRKVVISTGRPRPVYNLPWEQARCSLDYKGPSFWSRVSSDGLILSISGNVSDVFEAEGDAASRLDQPNTTSLAGMHLSDVVNSEAMASMSTALHSLSVSGIPHLMNNGVGGVPVTVISTLIPSSAGGDGLPTVFVHTQRVSVGDWGEMQVNKIHSQAPSLTKSTETAQSARQGKGEALGNSVLGELSTHRSSSWVLELHQLKIANKRLREEIRSLQRKLTCGPPVCTMPAHSHSKSKIAYNAALSNASLTFEFKAHE